MPAPKSHLAPGALRDAAAGLDEHRAVAAAMDALVPALAEVAGVVCECLDRGGRVLSFGNGGSAADAQHLAAELIGHYRRDRRALAAVALSVDPSVVTAIANDYTYDDVFSRQVSALAQPGDVVVAFTTSGRSANVVAGLASARERGAITVVFTGGDGGAALAQADHALVVPSSTTARVQEMHLLLLHLLSETVDEWAARAQSRDA